MYHIKEKTISEIEVKKSKFICILLPLNDDNKIKETIGQLKKEYPNATHYCYGSIIGQLCRSNDDGEPSSTAGKPILEALRHHDLDNVLAVVVRYFGGTLLGTSGLVKAYGQVTSDAIAAASFTVPTTVYNYSLEVNYEYTNRIEMLLKNKATLLSREFDQKATYFYQCETDLSNDIRELTNGSAINKYINEEIIEK